MWTGVNGPVTAAVATAHRLKWRFTSHCALQTDDGRELVLTRDPPAVVVKHVKLAVRRWRLARVIHDLPALLPPLPIRTNAWQPLSSRLLPDAVLLDESVLAQLMCGRGVPRDVKKICSKDARAWLRSTAIGAHGRRLVWLLLHGWSMTTGASYASPAAALYNIATNALRTSHREDANHPAETLRKA